MNTPNNTPAAVVRLNAGNDTNGNPRRLFVGLNLAGGIEHVFDEGYLGEHVMPPHWWPHYAGITFTTTPAFYRSLLRMFPQEGA